MHELSIALHLLELARAEARRHDANVLTLYVQLGPLSGVVSEALASAYLMAREGTELSQCELVIERTPLTAYCARCTGEVDVESLHALRCRRCGGSIERLTGGDELELRAVELEGAA